MPHTPSSESATTRKPETAPPRMATWTASTRLRRAAAAVRTLERTETVMPMMPDAIEHAAPTRKANAVRAPIGMPARAGTSATSFDSTRAMTMPMITDATTARTAIVVYWRLTKASAPSRMMSPTSCMACGPLSRLRTSRARYNANRIAMIPAIGTSNWSVWAIGFCRASYAGFMPLSVGSRHVSWPPGSLPDRVLLGSAWGDS